LPAESGVKYTTGFQPQQYGDLKQESTCGEIQAAELGLQIANKHYK